MARFDVFLDSGVTVDVANESEVRKAAHARFLELLQSDAYDVVIEAAEVVTPKVRREWAIPMGGQVGLDTASSASRQHRIDTGEYLREGEAYEA